MTYKIWIDKRAEVTRKQLRQLAVKDLASSTMRWSLHLSEEEANYLEMNNPDFDWNKFTVSNESKPYRIGTRV